jgi:hypothetical protein
MAVDDFTPAALPHSTIVEDHHSDDDKKNYYEEDSKEKIHGTANVEITAADQEHLDAVLDMEKRIQDGTATREVSPHTGYLVTSRNSR